MRGFSVFTLIQAFAPPCGSSEDRCFTNGPGLWSTFLPTGLDTQEYENIRESYETALDGSRRGVNIKRWEVTRACSAEPNSD